MTNDATVSRFDQASAQYQTSSIKYRKLSADLVSELAAPAPADIILDIGCGTGTQLIELSGHIQQGIGIDISSGMVKSAITQRDQAGCSNLAFYIGDFLDPEKEISLRRKKINKVISNYALHHLPLSDKKKALNKMIEILGAHLERIIIGDLMFFDDPQQYAGQYGEIGYGPGVDLPCRAHELANLFDKHIFTVTLHQIHPLVGVLKAVRH